MGRRTSKTIVVPTSVLPAYYCAGRVAVPGAGRERYAGRCGHVCRAGHVGRDCALGLLVLLIVATVIGAMFLLVFFVLQDLTHTGQSATSGETLLVAERSGLPKVQENRLSAANFGRTSTFEVREEIVLTPNLANQSTRQPKYAGGGNRTTSFVQLQKLNNSIGEDDIFADELQFVSLSPSLSLSPSSSSQPSSNESLMPTSAPTPQSETEEHFMNISDEITFHVGDSVETPVPDSDTHSPISQRENGEKHQELPEPVFEPFDVDSDPLSTTRSPSSSNSRSSEKSSTDSLEFQDAKIREQSSSSLTPTTNRAPSTSTTGAPSSTRASELPEVSSTKGSRSTNSDSALASTSRVELSSSTSQSSEIGLASTTMKSLPTGGQINSTLYEGEGSFNTGSERKNNRAQQIDNEAIEKQSHVNSEAIQNSHSSTDSSVKLEIVTPDDIIGLDELLAEAPQDIQAFPDDGVFLDEDKVKTTNMPSSETAGTSPDDLLHVIKPNFHSHSSSSNSKENTQNNKLSKNSTSLKKKVLSHHRNRSDDDFTAGESETNKSGKFSNQEIRVINIIEAPANLSTENPLQTPFVDTSSLDDDYLSIVVSGSQAGRAASPSHEEGIVTAQGIPEWATTQSTISEASGSSPVTTPAPPREESLSTAASDVSVDLQNLTTIKLDSAPFFSTEKMVEEVGNDSTSSLSAEKMAEEEGFDSASATIVSTEANDLLSGGNLAALARDGVSELVVRTSARLQAARSLDVEQAAALASSGDGEISEQPSEDPNEETKNLIQDEVVQWLESKANFFQDSQEHSGDGEDSIGRSDDQHLDTLHNAEKVDEECPVGKFQCGGGTCISLEQLCDGVEHCSNGFDEMDCFSGDIYFDL